MAQFVDELNPVPHIYGCRTCNKKAKQFTFRVLFGDMTKTYSKREQELVSEYKLSPYRIGRDGTTYYIIPNMWKKFKFGHFCSAWCAVHYANMQADKNCQSNIYGEDQ